jgi:exonuclease III
MDNYHHINIAHWNANSISNKIIELYQFILEQHIDIICIAETHLKEHNILHTNPDYHIHRLDRTDGNKGGVAIRLVKI